MTGSLLTIPIVDRLVSDYIVKHDHIPDSDWQFINNSNSRSSSVVKHAHIPDSDWQFINNSSSRSSSVGLYRETFSHNRQ